MAVVWPSANTNWSTVASWQYSGGAYGQLPQVGDLVYMDGKTVTADMNINIGTGSIRTDQRVGGTAGGQFTCGTFTVTANIIAGTTTCLMLATPSSTAIVYGDITGGTSTNAYGVFVGTASFILHGNYTGGSGSNANGVHATTGSFTQDSGIATGGTGGFAFFKASTGTANLDGNATAGTVAAISSLGTVNYNGTATASATANAIIAPNVCNFSGTMVNVAGMMAVYCPRIFIQPATDTVWTIQDTDGDDVLLYTADAFDYPIEADVRDGVNYGTIYDGTLAVPPPASVALNVPVDDTVGELVTATTPADFIAALKLDDLGKRLGKCATTEEVDMAVASAIT